MFILIAMTHTLRKNAAVFRIPHKNPDLKNNIVSQQKRSATRKVYFYL